MMSNEGEKSHEPVDIGPRPPAHSQRELQREELPEGTLKEISGEEDDGYFEELQPGVYIATEKFMAEHPRKLTQEAIDRFAEPGSVLHTLLSQQLKRGQKSEGLL